MKQIRIKHYVDLMISGNWKLQEAVWISKSELESFTEICTPTRSLWTGQNQSSADGVPSGKAAKR